MRVRVLGTIAILLAGCLIGTQSQAGVRLPATGFYRMQFGELGFPFQFFVGMVTGTHGTPLGFPNGDAACDGSATLPFPGMASITLPAKLCGGSYMGAPVAPGGPVTQFHQITSSFTMLSAPATTSGAMFVPGFGMGFTYCRGGGSACGAAGRVIYTPGKNGFGGVSRVLVAGSINVSRILGSYAQPTPLSVYHSPFFPHQGIAGVGGPYAAMQTGATQIGAITRPLMRPISGSPVASPGPRRTVMGAFTSCPGGGPHTNLPTCTVGTGQPAAGVAVLQTVTGFPFTTGTIVAQQSSGTSPDYFTLQGSDARTPGGVGNLSLVAGGLANRVPNGSSSQAHTLFLTFSKPVPSITGGGMAAGAILIVLGAGYGLRPRR